MKNVFLMNKNVSKHIIQVRLSSGANLTPDRDVHTLSHMSLTDFAACVLITICQLKRQASCLQQQTVCALDTHTS